MNNDKNIWGNGDEQSMPTPEEMINTILEKEGEMAPVLHGEAVAAQDTENEEQESGIMALLKELFDSADSLGDGEAAQGGTGAAQMEAGTAQGSEEESVRAQSADPYKDTVYYAHGFEPAAALPGAQDDTQAFELAAMPEEVEESPRVALDIDAKLDLILGENQDWQSVIDKVDEDRIPGQKVEQPEFFLDDLMQNTLQESDDDAYAIDLSKIVPVHEDETKIGPSSFYQQNPGTKPGFGGAPNKPYRGKSTRARLSIPASICMLALCLLAGFAGAKLGGNGPTVVFQTAPPTSGGNVLANPGAATVADIVEQVRNTVVEVVTENASYSNFFNRGGQNGGGGVISGAGSGVIISEDGYIITNHHVISGAASVKVVLADGSTYTAKVVGSDPVNDIAVLKIEASGLQSAVLGSSKNLRVGEAAIAIGNPLGTLGGTVTDGIISALDRDVTVDGQTMTLLQTNAAVNPGNSGGGLFNMNGELVGIVNAKSSGEDIEGLGFAIPIDVAKEVAKELIENGSVSGRPAIGITIIDIDSPELMQEYDVARQGVYVYTVTKGTGAEGVLEEGDYIVSIDEQAVTNSGEIASILAEHEVGDRIDIQIIRDQRTMTVRITLTEMQ
ncbi:trypsin-like peptidase domain-containing protein [Ruminococcaceae bacterium OttesenSCG-928-N02]|nr:trypsin-like peptidase domain-containing protein [Ruminococcaceae bacterium OttesenSCG-928-N02]